MKIVNNFLRPSWAEIFNINCGFTLPVYGNQALTRPSKSGSLLLNRQKLAEVAGFDIDKMFAPHQVHGNTVLFVDNNNCGRGICDLKDAVDGDACYTATVGVTLITTWADCIPVLIYDARQKFVAAVHSGWRGTAKNVVACTIAAMKSNPVDVYASVGPGIRGCCYEVGENVAAEFENMSEEIKFFVIRRDGRVFLDLQSIVHRQLLECNIPDSQIDRSTSCTCCSENPIFFSCRKDGKELFEGQAAFICL